MEKNNHSRAKKLFLDSSSSQLRSILSRLRLQLTFRVESSWSQLQIKSHSLSCLINVCWIQTHHWKTSIDRQSPFSSCSMKKEQKSRFKTQFKSFCAVKTLPKSLSMHSRLSIPQLESKSLMSLEEAVQYQQSLYNFPNSQIFYHLLFCRF